MTEGFQELILPPNGSKEFASRIVMCPHCKGDSVYHASNPARPFCSPRCRAMDLGAWANEDFRVADTNAFDDPHVDEA